MLRFGTHAVTFSVSVTSILVGAFRIEHTTGVLPLYSDFVLRDSSSTEFNGESVISKVFSNVYTR
jgi:hypothetical protein